VSKLPVLPIDLILTPYGVQTPSAINIKTKIIFNFGLTKKCFVGLLPLDSWDRLSGEDAWDKATEELAHRDGLAYAYSCALLAHQLFKGVFYVFF
jgi:hypothetical protein